MLRLSLSRPATLRLAIRTPSTPRPSSNRRSRWRIIGIAAIRLRHTDLPAELRPSVLTTFLLWASTAVMLGFASYYVWSRLAA